MVKRKSWEEFRKSGLLWFINSILHLFGWAIVLKMDEGKVIDAYPARVAYRGFIQESNTRGYKNVTDYLKENIEELSEEANDEYDSH